MTVKRISIEDMVRILTDIQAEGFQQASMEITEINGTHTISIFPCRPDKITSPINKSFDIDGFLSQVSSGSKRA